MNEEEFYKEKIFNKIGKEELKEMYPLSSPIAPPMMHPTYLFRYSWVI